MTLADDFSFEIAAILKAYEAGAATPVEVVNLAYDRISAWADDAAWITVVPREAALAHASRLPTDAAGHPLLNGLSLYGVPFSVKDNIDVAGLPTTAGCEDFAYVPEVSAPLVDALIAAGAVLIGKNNLDQFATGLSGMRSPYGTPRNAVTPGMVPGGSSSGSASAVSAGLVSFSIGTDTAGSGRVPAALQAIVGVKPSRGLVSTRGMVPACRSLDCPSVFALTVADGQAVLATVAGFDALDPWSRDMGRESTSVLALGLEGVTFAVPRSDQLGWSDDVGLADAWLLCIERLTEAGARCEEIDMEPFFAAGSLLYGGPWIAERWAGLEEFAVSHADSLHPVTRAVLAPGRDVTGVAAFRGYSRLRELRRECAAALEGMHALLTPTTTAAFSLEDMEGDPIRANAALGRFATFVNLLDLAAIAVPAGTTAAGAPFGVTLHAAAGSDPTLAALAVLVEGASPRTLGATGWQPTAPATASGRSGSPQPASIPVAVAGAHLEGLPLHGDLLATGATLMARTTTAPSYKLFALHGTVPRKPGLARVATGGAEIDVEVYSMPIEQMGPFLATIPAPLGIGTLELADGSTVHGFICEPYALDAATDVTAYGGWRSYLDVVNGDGAGTLGAVSR